MHAISYKYIKTLIIIKIFKRENIKIKNNCKEQRVNFQMYAFKMELVVLFL
jgi:hypothetical protein